MPKVHLTKRLIDNSCFQGDGRNMMVLWDDKVSGLGVRISPAGAKAFIVWYRHEGRVRFHTLGKYGSLTLDQARKLAHVKLAEVAKGGDPQAARDAKLQAPTMADLALRYIEEHAKPHKRSWKDDLSHVNNFVLPAWGTRKVAAISTSDIARMHGKIGKENGKFRANRTLATIHKMFELAIQWGYLDTNVRNPAHGITKFREERRHRPLTMEEIPRLITALDKEPNNFARAAILLLLFTGCRRGEVLSARWDQVDLENRVLVLPRTKSGRTYTVPLSAPAITILRELPHEMNNPFIFPGRTGGRLTTIRDAWLRALAKAKLPDNIRVHDLRHSFGTSLASAGVSLTIVGAAMNHSQPSVTARYAVPAENPVRQAVEDHAQRIIDTVKGQKLAKVISLISTGENY